MNCSRIRMLEAQKDFCNSRGDYFSWLGMQVPRRLESILKKERHNSKRMWVIVSIGLGIVNGSGKIPKKNVLIVTAIGACLASSGIWRIDNRFNRRGFVRFGRRSRKVRKSNARERGRGEPSQVPVDLERTNPRDKMVFFFSLFLAQCMVHFSYVGGEGEGYCTHTKRASRY